MNIRKRKVSNKIKANLTRPRLLVNRTNAAIYCQVVDASGKVIASASSLKSSEKDNILKAKAVGEEVAKKALAAKIGEVTFDRRGYKYHGRVKALAEGARSAGLKF